MVADIVAQALLSVSSHPQKCDLIPLNELEYTNCFLFNSHYPNHYNLPLEHISNPKILSSEKLATFLV